MEIGGVKIKPGERKIIDLPLGRLYDFTEMTLTVQVIRGKLDGPTLFLSGAVHGDEIVGVSIVKRIASHKRLAQLKGTIIAIPIVNVFGFNTRSRYLPDRRDLNRCFPGAKKGSLGSNIAAIFLEEIVKKSQYGIDFHSGAIHRKNLPQIRTSIEVPQNREMAEAFGAPVILDSKLRDGSLREAANDLGVNMLLFEGGEALRSEDNIVKSGVRGTFSVMEKIAMLPEYSSRHSNSTYLAHSSYWVRAPESGMVQFTKSIGSKVKAHTQIAVISDAFGKNKTKVFAPTEGIVIGLLTLPLVNKGDAMFHIATFEDSAVVKEIEEDLIDYID